MKKPEIDLHENEWKSKRKDEETDLTWKDYLMSGLISGLAALSIGLFQLWAK